MFSSNRLWILRLQFVGIINLEFVSRAPATERSASVRVSESAWEKRSLGSGAPATGERVEHERQRDVAEGGVVVRVEQRGALIENASVASGLSGVNGRSIGQMLDLRLLVYWVKFFSVISSYGDCLSRYNIRINEMVISLVFIFVIVMFLM